MLTTQFLLTSLIVVVMPGTGVLYTLSNGMARGGRAGIAAALGCTLGILPHLLASALGLSAIMHVSATVFSVVKYGGSAYLLFLAWQMWKETGALAIGHESTESSLVKVALRGVALNILNPKLTIFFLAFLPQFITPGVLSATRQLVGLSAVFMLMTLVVFCLYALLAGGARKALSAMPRSIRWIQRSFAVVFAGLAVELAFTRR
ncbi:LysE family translocator [Limnochorda pilosa]|uniref:Lysine transporter LysE n=1 Tax=Limnochorda pilosa TaxID=1555112 RepID=A0A0K2SIW1_LIMPI|nr:LysE family translocator [Limnochorda pilosa]BAS26764.1 lysine transporter LysE [Limnochorda pilosa]